MTPPERSPERDGAILAMLPLVPLLGWSVAALTEAAGPDADLLFPGGPSDMVEAHSDLADRQMEADVAAFDLSGLGVAARVRTVVAHRLQQQEPHKDAVRRGLAVLAVPGRGLLAARVLARTVDAVWHAAGDTSSDFSWYTKRATLAAVYSSTLLYWLRDGSEGSADTMAFLDRQLGRLGRLGRARRAGRGLRRVS